MSGIFDVNEFVKVSNTNDLREYLCAIAYGRLVKGQVMSNAEIVKNDLFIKFNFMISK